MEAFAYYIYNFIVLRLSYLILQGLRPFLSGKIRKMIEDKNSHWTVYNHGDKKSIRKNRPIWLHAASGEIEYARSVIREIKRKYPDVPVLITYSSPSAKKILPNIKEADAWTALPWDFFSHMRLFIKRWNPRILLIARTDAWPNMIKAAHEAQLPSMLFSATFAENSSRLRGFTKYLTSHTLKMMTEIHCVSQEDAQNIQRFLPDTKICVSGDTRFDQVFHRLEHPKPLNGALIPSPDDMILICGSTWPEDEKVILPALKNMTDSAFRCIIAPHEIGEEHLASLEEHIQTMGMNSIRYSDADSWPKNCILIIDQIGILAELYTWADLAFIGGSFKKQVHSVMEALAAGVPVMVGPHHLNNREALVYKRKNYSSGMIVQVVHNSHDLNLLMQRFKKQHYKIAKIKEEIRQEIGKNKNSTLNILTAIETQTQELGPDASNPHS